MKYVSIAILVSVLMLFSCKEKEKEKENKNPRIEIEVFRIEDARPTAWGYDIYLDGKKYVHQPHIPAISGIRGFDSRGDARKTADMIARKIRKGIMPPTISVEELDSLGVLK